LLSEALYFKPTPNSNPSLNFQT